MCMCVCESQGEREGKEKGEGERSKLADRWTQRDTEIYKEDVEKEAGCDWRREN